MNASLPDTLGEDLLIGAAALARYVFGSDAPKYRRRIYYLCTAAKCPLPHLRIGFQLAARKTTIARWIEAQEAQPEER